MQYLDRYFFIGNLRAEIIPSKWPIVEIPKCSLLFKSDFEQGKTVVIPQVQTYRIENNFLHCTRIMMLLCVCVSCSMQNCQDLDRSRQNLVITCNLCHYVFDLWVLWEDRRGGKHTELEGRKPVRFLTLPAFAVQS